MEGRQKEMQKLESERKKYQQLYRRAQKDSEQVMVKAEGKLKELQTNDFKVEQRLSSVQREADLHMREIQRIRDELNPSEVSQDSTDVPEPLDSPRTSPQQQQVDEVVTVVSQLQRIIERMEREKEEDREENAQLRQDNELLRQRVDNLYDELKVRQQPEGGSVQRWKSEGSGKR